MNQTKSKNLKILLVDDSELVLKHVAALLGSGGWDISTAKNVAEGLESYFKSPPDAVLSDFVLGTGQTGLDLLSAILAARASADPNAPRLPVALLTLGALSDVDAERAAKMGAPVIQKPARGKEKEFLQNVEFWLHDVGLI